MSARGMTLVEVMIAMAIFSIIMVSITVSLMQGSDQVAYELPRDELGTTMQAIFERIELVLRDARVTKVAADGSWVDFKVPVDIDNDGDVFVTLDPFQIDWGVVKEIGPGGVQVSAATGTLAFVLRKDGAVLSEIALGKNINPNTERPRDMTDVFDLGEIVFTSTDDPSWHRRLGGDFILQPSGAWGKDIDGEGTGDPIFSGTGKQLTVRLFMGRAPTGVPPILMSRTVTIFLRNQITNIEDL